MSNDTYSNPTSTLDSIIIHKKKFKPYDVKSCFLALNWKETYARNVKDIPSIEPRLSWDRYLDNESFKNINGMQKRIFWKGYCISKPATIF